MRNSPRILTALRCLGRSRGAAAVLCGLLWYPVDAVVGQDNPIELRPGHPRLAEFSFTPFVATYQVFIDSDSGAQKAEYWKWHLQESTVAGRPAYRLVWSLFFSQVTIYDQVMVAAGTFEPITRTIFSHRGTDVVDFTGDRPRYTYVPLARLRDSTLQTRDLEIEGARFGGGDLLALVAMRPEVGERFRMALYATDPSPALGSSEWSSAEVVGTEAIDAGGRTYRTTVIKRDPWTLWIADHPPYVIRRAAGDRRWELVDVWPTQYSGR